MSPRKAQLTDLRSSGQPASVLIERRHAGLFPRSRTRTTARIKLRRRFVNLTSSADALLGAAKRWLSVYPTLRSNVSLEVFPAGAGEGMSSPRHSSSEAF